MLDREERNTVFNTKTKAGRKEVSHYLQAQQWRLVRALEYRKTMGKCPEIWDALLRQARAVAAGLAEIGD